MESAGPTFDALQAPIEMTYDYEESVAPRLTKKNRRGILEPQICSLLGLSARLTGLNSNSGTIDDPGESSCQRELDNEIELSPIQVATPYPTHRRPCQRTLSDESDAIIDEWFQTLGTKIGKLTDNQQRQLKRLLYTYQDLDAKELQNLPPTDLYTHRVRLKEGTKPHSVAKQKRWPAAKEYWLQRHVNEGLSCGFYERTMVANGQLSDWNAQAVVVDKVENPQPWDEPRITFNYRNVIEQMPGCYMELSSKLHDYLGHPTHKSFLKFDLKNAYWCVPVHPADRHYFAFTISGIGQLQQTRMPQGSMTSGYSMTELMYIMLGQIPPNEPGHGDFAGQPSVIVAPDENSLPMCGFYVDDIFGGCQDFEEGYRFMADELFPRVAWARMRLSFKKMELFMEEVVALGVTHKSGGLISTKPERLNKIRMWPVPKSATQVREFVGAIGITRRFVKNFAEIKLPLSRLTGNVDWRWGKAEQVSFEILRQKCSDVLDMHGWDGGKSAIYFYSDASKHGAGCCITQRRNGIEVAILYDAFTFTKSQRNYGTYKRELCAIVEFSRKFDYMFRGPATATVFTDHQPLTYFLKSSNIEGIYARWASELRQLNLEIRWIPGSRNKVADALSRTIFPDPEGNSDDYLDDFGHLDLSGTEPEWVWKDGKNGYEELVRQVGEPLHDEELRRMILGEPPTVLPGASSFIARLRQADPMGVERSKSKYLPTILRAFASEGVRRSFPPRAKYRACEWYSEIASFLISSEYPDWCVTKTQIAAFHRKLDRYSTNSQGVLYVQIRGAMKRCILPSEVATVLMAAHDNGGHFWAAITIRKMIEVYWPSMAKDTRDYILGCLRCAQHGTARRTQTLTKVTVSSVMELLGADWIGPFPDFNRPDKIRWILLVIDYFSRYAWAKAFDTNDSTAVISFLSDIFGVYGVPVGVYTDPGPHFGAEVVNWAKEQGVVWTTSPSGAKKATGMIEKAVDVFQRVLKKTCPAPQLWPEWINRALYEFNNRYIAHLGYSPFEIMLGFDGSDMVSQQFPALRRQSLAALINNSNDELEVALPNSEDHADLVVDYMVKRQEIREVVDARSDLARQRTKERHDLGVHPDKTLVPGQLVMLFDERQSGKKLRAAWRGPFVIVGYAGEMGRSYTLRQIDGTNIRGHFYGDHLKAFRLREGYLVTSNEQELPVFQNIRLGNAAFKLPKAVRSIAGAHHI
ncbi:hypothetical protein PZA11_002191 [Diplocarpon coronariae]